MELTLWCLFLAILLPLVPHAAKIYGRLQAGFDNHRPRALENLPPWVTRAAWAEANAYEALPGFIAAILVSLLMQADSGRTGTLAVIFILARLAHTVCYLMDQASMRTLVWTVGFLCTIWLFVQNL
jgi:uncharacterized MAPEG superfamily protein